MYVNHWCASIPDLGDETPADWSLEPVDIDPPPLPAELVDPIGPPPPLVCWYKLLLICWWFTLDILVHSSDQTPRLLSKFTLEVSFRLLNPFHFFFQNTEFRCGWSCVFKMELFFGPINLVCVKRVRNCAMWVCKNGLPQRQWQIDNEWWIKYLVGVLHYQDLFFFRFLMWWWWRRMWIRRYARQARRSFFTELKKGKRSNKKMKLW